jgi:hypothetical protein
MIHLYDPFVSYFMRRFWEVAAELRVLCTVCRSELSQWRGGPCALCYVDLGVGA